MKEPTNSAVSPPSYPYFYSDSAQPVTTAVDSVTSTKSVESSSLQCTASPEGPVVKWVSPPILTQVTISGSITFNGWGLESEEAANARLDVQVWKYSGRGESTQVIDSQSGSVLGTSNSAQNWSATPRAGVSFEVGDRIVVKWLINSAKRTMSGGQTVTLKYGGNRSGRSGDTWVEFTETISFQKEAQFIQAASSDNGAATKATVGFDHPTTRGSFILCLFHWDNQAITITSIDDRLGNTFKALSPRANFNTNVAAQIWYAKNITGGAPFITAHFSGTTASYSLITVAEISGLDGANPIDVFGTTATGSGTVFDTGTSPQTNYATDMIVGAFVTAMSSFPFTPERDYIIGIQEATSLIALRIANATSTFKVTATGTGGSRSWAGQVIALKTATGP